MSTEQSGERVPLAKADRRAMPGDGRCEDCRKGHYTLQGGVVSNYPCTANRPEQAWWQDHVEPHRDRPGSPLRVEFLRDRRRFILPGQTEVRPNDRPPFGVALLIWSDEA